MTNNILEKISIEIGPLLNSLVAEIYSLNIEPPKWLTKNELASLRASFTREDLLQDLYCFSFTFFKKQGNSNLYSLLRKYLPLYIRDLARKELHRTIAEDSYSSGEELSTEIEDDKQFLSLKWALVDPDESLSVQERYLLYLYYNRSYTLEELQHLLYASDKTINKNLKETSKKCLKQIMLIN